MKRVLIGLGVVGVVLSALLFALFPTDEILKSALSGLNGAGRPQISYRSSALRPWGLTVDGVAVHGVDGQSMVAIDQLRIRPTLGALLHFTWHPLKVSADIGGGTLTVAGDFADLSAASLQASWSEIQLKQCGLPALLAGVGGHTSGTAEVLTSSGQTSKQQGNGHLEFGDAHIPIPEDQVPGLAEIAIEQFATDWTLEQQKLTLASTSFKTPEVQGQGQGTILIRENLGNSGIQARFTVKPQPYIPPILEKIFRALPPAPGEPGAYLLIVDGTLNKPQIVRNQ